MTKTQIINELISTHRFTSYLEIGLCDALNFRGVQCENKIGVDPDKRINLSNVFNVPSDSFFNQVNEKYDLIFIDGLHHAEQVERDIVNSWNALNKGGIILLHDVKPEEEWMTILPRKQRIWTGDVFRAWHGFNEKYPKIKTAYIGELYGIGVIYKSRHKVDPGFVSDISFSEYYAMKGWEPKKD